MSKQCDLTGKRAQFGNNVSHSQRKTRRRFEPNIQPIALVSEALGRKVSLKLATSTLRTINKKGGLDAFLLGTRALKLTPEALKLKHKVRKAKAAAAK